MNFKSALKALLACSLVVTSYGATMAIVSKTNPSMCLDLFEHGDSPLERTGIVTEKCVSDLLSQQWFFDAGSWRIRSALNPRKCIGVEMSPKGSPWGALRILGCDKNSTDQLFGWDDSTAAIFKTAKKEEHVNPLSSICFHAGSKAGDWVYLRPFNATDTLQQWSAVQGPPLATMAIVPKAHPSSCLDLLGQSALDGTSIVTEKCVAGLISQQWFFDAGSWRIRSALNPKKCIDWQSIKGDPKGNLNLNACAANSTSQLFGWDANTSAIFESPEKGTHAKVGSMCFRAGSKNEGNVTVRGCNATDTLQQWSATFRLPGTALASILV